MNGPPKIVVAYDLHQETYPWLPFGIAVGSILYLASDTYNVCSNTGIAVSLTPNGKYFEIPEDAAYKYMGYISSLN